MTVIDPEPFARESLARLVRLTLGFEIAGELSTVSAFRKWARHHSAEVVIADVRGPGALRELRRIAPKTRLVVFSRQRVPKRSPVPEVRWLDKRRAGSAELLAAVEQTVVGGTLSRAPGSGLGTLTLRQREVLSFVAGGADNLKIATLLGVGERTVKEHVSHLYRKLALDNRTELALFARDAGLSPPSPHP